jgi:ribokinase
MVADSHQDATARSGLAAVTVVGNLCVDLVMRGMAAIPRWGQEVEASTHAAVPGGQGFNAAAALAALDVPTRLVGVVGDDANGRLLLAAAGGAGVDIAHVATVDAPTALTVAMVREDGERAFASDFGCQRHFGEADIARAWDAGAAASVMCLFGVFNMPGLTLAAATRLLARARSEGRTTVLDTGWDPREWPSENVEAVLAMLRHVDVFVPNLDEARALTGATGPEAASAALVAHGAGSVVVKCGSDGAHGRRGGDAVHVGALPVVPRDAVGAGDTFDAGLVAGLVAGWPLRDCLALAAATAGIFVSREADRRPSRRVAVDAARRLHFGRSASVAQRSAQ